MLWAARAPVNWTQTRAEAHISDDDARDNNVDAALALDRDGKFLAVKIRSFGNLGAFVWFRGAMPPVVNIGTVVGTYTTPAGMAPGLYETATFRARTNGNYPNGCHVCEVEIDPDTGTTQLVGYWVVDDVGTVINPMLLKGQIMGGIAQGMGQVLMEDKAYDAAGQVLGWLLIAAFVALNVSAMRIMRRSGTTVRPDRGTDHLVTDGLFAFTRNPLYLAGTMLIVGIGLVAGIAWFLLLAILAAFMVQKLAIEREEMHLQARFGETYREYARRVRRWI